MSPQEFKRLRIKAGLSQEELAKLLGSKKSYISNIECAHRNISDRMSKLMLRIMSEIVDVTDSSSSIYTDIEEIKIMSMALTKKIDVLERKIKNRNFKKDNKYDNKD